MIRYTALRQRAMRPLVSVSLRQTARHLCALPTTAEQTDAAKIAKAPKSKFSSLMELGKPRLSALVVVSSCAGLGFAGLPLDVPALLAVTSGTFFAACSANTFNQVWEIKNDTLMRRTWQRPLPTGRVTKAEALAFGASMGAAGTAILAVGCNPLTAALGLANIGLYSLVYTPMKVRSEYNTAMGAIVGAIPPMMGWAAATGTLAGPEPILLALVLYLWQFPHFYSLAWRSRIDYARGGYQMVPVNDPTGSRTSMKVLLYSVAMFSIPVMAVATGATNPMFGIEAVGINAYATYLAWQFYQNPTNGSATKVFRCSLWYLPLMLALMVFHSSHWSTDEKEHAQRALDARRRFAQSLQGTSLGDALVDLNDYMHHLSTEFTSTTSPSNDDTGAASGAQGASSSSGQDCVVPEERLWIGPALAQGVSCMKHVLKAACVHEMAKEDDVTTDAATHNADSADGSIASVGTDHAGQGSATPANAGAGKCPIVLTEQATSRVLDSVKGTLQKRRPEGASQAATGALKAHDGDAPSNSHVSASDREPSASNHASQ